MAISNNIRNNLVSRPTANQVITNPLFNGLRINDNVERTVNKEISDFSNVSFLNFPFDLPKYYFGIIEVKTVGKISGAEIPGPSPTGVNLQPVGGYRLPLPSTLMDGYEIQYDHGFNWLSFFNVSGVNTLLNAVTGFSVNNFKQVTLQAPQFRSYSFEWKLNPKTKEESERIKQIEMKIKQGMHPSASLGFTNRADLVFRFPNMFICFLFPNSNYLFNFKPAVITGIQVDYQGGNHRNIFYKETGAPESVIMKLTFLEIDYWISSDFNRDLLSGGRNNIVQAPITNIFDIPLNPVEPQQ